MQQREEWAKLLTGFDADKLFFLDETGTNTKMARHYGRSPRGKRCLGSVPFGHWKTVTLTACLTLEGIKAPMTLDKAMDSNAFRAYVQYVLVPELKPGSIVVMDNLPVHKVQGVRQMNRAVFTGDKRSDLV